LDTEENFSCLKLKKISIFGFRWRTYFGILKIKFQISGRWLLASTSSSTLNCTFFHSQFLLSISDLFLNNFSLYNAPPINSHDWGISLYPSTASNGGVEQNFELWRPIYIYIYANNYFFNDIAVFQNFWKFAIFTLKTRICNDLYSI
jgi:hypothetical protein